MDVARVVRLRGAECEWRGSVPRSPTAAHVRLSVGRVRREPGSAAADHGPRQYRHDAALRAAVRGRVEAGGGEVDGGRDPTVNTGSSTFGLRAVAVCLLALLLVEGSARARSPVHRHDKWGHVLGIEIRGLGYSKIEVTDSHGGRWTFDGRSVVNHLPGCDSCDVEHMDEHWWAPTQSSDAISLEPILEVVHPRPGAYRVKAWMTKEDSVGGILVAFRSAGAVVAVVGGAAPAQDTTWEWVVEPAGEKSPVVRGVGGSPMNPLRQ